MVDRKALPWLFLLRLANTPAQAKRDIVQFVKMLDYKGLGSGPRLARDVLHEMPDQVVRTGGGGRGPALGYLQAFLLRSDDDDASSK